MLYHKRQWRNRRINSYTPQYLKYLFYTEAFLHISPPMCMHRTEEEQLQTYPINIIISENSPLL